MLTHTYIVVCQRDGPAYSDPQRGDALVHQIQRCFPGVVTLHRGAWVVFTPLSASQIRDQLNGHLTASDRLFVAGLSEQAAWHGYTEPETEWLGRLFNPFD